MKKGSYMICKNCGREIPDSSKFCFGCGAIVNTVAPSEASRAQQPPNRMQESSEAAQPISSFPGGNPENTHSQPSAENTPSSPSYYPAQTESSKTPPAQGGGTPPVNGVGSVFPGFSSSQSDQAGYPIHGEYSPNTAYVSYTDSADYSGRANNLNGVGDMYAGGVPMQQSFPGQEEPSSPSPQFLQSGAYTYYAQSSRAGAAVKKSKKGFIIGLSVGGGVLLILIVVLILVLSGIFKSGGNLPSLVYDDNTISYGTPFKDVEEMVSDIYLYEGDSTLAFSDEMGNTTLLVRDEETVVGWYIQDRGTEISSGLKVGDRFSKMEELYPDAEYNGSGPFDPDEGYAGEFIVYYDPSGYICTEDQYEEYVDNADDDDELAALRVMVITIKDGRVKDIIFSDERMYSYME